MTCVISIDFHDMPWSCIQNCIQKHRKKQPAPKQTPTTYDIYVYIVMIVSLFDTDSFGHKAVSNLWFFWEPFGATLWEPLENRFSKNRTPPRVPRPWLDWKFHYCGKNFWQTSFCQKKCYVKNCFLRVIPTLTHYSDIVSDIPSGRIYILLPI